MEMSNCRKLDRSDSNHGGGGIDVNRSGEGANLVRSLKESRGTEWGLSRQKTRGTKAGAHLAGKRSEIKLVPKLEARVVKEETYRSHDPVRPLVVPSGEQDVHG